MESMSTAAETQSQKTKHGSTGDHMVPPAEPIGTPGRTDSSKNGRHGTPVEPSSPIFPFHGSMGGTQISYQLGASRWARASATVPTVRGWVITKVRRWIRIFRCFCAARQKEREMRKTPN